jgi:hypothetical protein
MQTGKWVSKDTKLFFQRKIELMTEEGEITEKINSNF